MPVKKLPWVPELAQHDPQLHWLIHTAYPSTGTVLKIAHPQSGRRGIPTICDHLCARSVAPSELCGDPLRVQAQDPHVKAEVQGHVKGQGQVSENSGVRPCYHRDVQIWKETVQELGRQL